MHTGFVHVKYNFCCIDRVFDDSTASSIRNYTKRGLYAYFVLSSALLHHIQKVVSALNFKWFPRYTMQQLVFILIHR